MSERCPCEQRGVTGMPGMSASMAQALKVPNSRQRQTLSMDWWCVLCKVKNTFYDFETDCTPLGNRPLALAFKA